jgi:hypothetical protein
MAGEWLAMMKDITRAHMKTNRFSGIPRRETFEEAKRANWPHYTCKTCFSPCGRDRDGLCESCVRDIKDGFFDKLTTIPKEFTPCHPPKP